MRHVLNRNKYARIVDLQQKLDLLPGKNQIFCDIIVFIFKIEVNMISNYLMELTTKRADVHSYRTRSSNDFCKGHRSKFQNKNSIFNTRLVDYSKLLKNIKEQLINN